MGYTHHWYRTRPFTDAEWSRIVASTQGILQRAAAAGVDIADWSGKPGTQPEVDVPCEEPVEGKVIAFNGRAPQDQESFILSKAVPPARRPSPEGVFQFCKTGRAPYDACVVSVLAIARQIAPEAITVKSDGKDQAIKNHFPEQPVPIHQRPLETVADIAFIAGAKRYHSGDSRQDVQDIITWAAEFEQWREVDAQGNETYHGKDYLTAIEEFALNKMNL